MMICFLKQSEFEVSYVFAWGKEGAVREVSNPFCVYVCVCVDHLLLSQVTYNNKEDSAMIHRLYGCTGPAVITVIISFHFAKRGKAHPVREGRGVTRFILILSFYSLFF